MENIEPLFEAVVVNNLSDYIAAIINFSNQFSGQEKLWFRGHASSEFNLCPSLFREVVRNEQGRPSHILRPMEIFEIEQGIDISFSRQATTFLSQAGIQNSKMNRYFLKQHYKIKTRLLDWTESSLVALYFAVSEDNHPNSDAQIWILRPFLLNSFALTALAKDKTKEAKYIFSSVDEFDKADALFTIEGKIRLNQLFRKYYELDVDKNEQMFPIAIYPPFLDDRMRAQQSCFTFFGNMFNGLIDAEEDQFLYSIKIPREVKALLLKELEILGFNNFSVYPDLDGLGHSINKQYKKRFEAESFEEHKSLLSYDLQNILVPPKK
jgi:hypothetical protein